MMGSFVRVFKKIVACLKSCLLLSNPKSLIIFITLKDVKKTQKRGHIGPIAPVIIVYEITSETELWN
jgi:hypothetical protein